MHFLNPAVDRRSYRALAKSTAGKPSGAKMIFAAVNMGKHHELGTYPAVSSLTCE